MRGRTFLALAALAFAAACGGGGGGGSTGSTTAVLPGSPANNAPGVTSTPGAGATTSPGTAGTPLPAGYAQAAVTVRVPSGSRGNASLARLPQNIGTGTNAITFSLLQTSGTASDTQLQSQFFP